MTPKPPRLNVPMLVKKYGIDAYPYQGTWDARMKHLGLWHTSIGQTSKRKAVLSVLQQAGIEIK